MKRRDFIKCASVSVALIPISNVLAIDLISTDDPTAVALKYVEKATDAERPDKMGVPGAEQICANCRFYADENAEVAGCSLFRNQLVPAEAWCAGWAPRS